MWKLNKRGMMCKSHRTIDDFFEMHPQLENKREEMLKEVNPESSIMLFDITKIFQEENK